VFIPDPFSTDHGLMNDDGTAGELLLPWRTSALLLGGAQYLGSIELPHGSQNHIFARSGDAVMVVWNDTPTKEVVYLGPEVHQVDIWGQSAVAGTQEHRQVIEVGPLPTFVTGVDPRITRWRQSFALASDRIPSVAGGRYANSLRFTNSFGEGVFGRFELIVPDSWAANPKETRFRLVREEELRQDFQSVLPPRATSGRHPVRADFELEGSGTHRFSVYRHVDVGSGDVYVEVVTRLNDQGELEVEQFLVNDTDEPVSFRCQLTAPNRRRQKTQIIGLRQGRDVRTYRLPNGKELLGKPLLLEAEQIGSPRVLNYRFVAEE
jgi:hypothetical protein